MFKKMCVNVVSVFCCVALLSAVGVVNCPPLAGVQGVEIMSENLKAGTTNNYAYDKNYSRLLTAREF